jgi:site-specific DNA-methyltransferase (adenine-specific)
MYRLVLGDCIEKMKEISSNSIDCIVTDPPYEIGFMDVSFDKTGIAHNVEMWKECLRILKPGGYLLSFGATRTYHRMACAIEDAGFEMRDCLMWIYGSGFPKSHNVGLGIDKHFGHSNRGRAIPSASTYQASDKEEKNKLTGNKVEEYTGKTELGKKYSGYGTALKPAYEPIVMCRKPFKGTVAKNVLEYGTGGINIDECRVGNEEITTTGPEGSNKYAGFIGKEQGQSTFKSTHIGRWPANILHDGSEEVVSLFPNTKSSNGSFKATDYEEKETSTPFTRGDFEGYGDSGSAARFFYSAKTSKKDRNEGCESLEEKQYSSDGREILNETAYQRNNSIANNNHPTVKPTDLMRYLVRLVCPEGGTVLDPFNGSGSTGKAALLEGFNYIGIDMDESYIEISKARLEHILRQKND